MRWPVALALVASMKVLAAAADATAPTDVSYVEDPKRWGSPKAVVRPDYPPDLLAARVTGYVDVEGIVGPDGTLDKVSYSPGDPGANAFIKELQSVVPYWSFHTSYGADCLPSDERVTVRVWFEIADGQPKISISRRTFAQRPDPKQMKPLDDPLPRPRFPYRALRDVVAATVYSRSMVEPDGSVSEVTTKAFSRDNPAPGILRILEDEVQRALLQWHYPPLEDGRGGKRASCMEVRFTRN